MRISVKDGVLKRPEQYREQWGLEAGTELLLERIEDGFALREIKPDTRRAYIEVTASCSLNCRICIRQVWRDAPGKMTWETFEAVVQQLRAFPSLERVTFGGYGEPLVHARIVEMMRQASELGAALALIIASRRSLTSLNEDTQQFSRTGSPYSNFLDELTLGGRSRTRP